MEYKIKALTVTILRGCMYHINDYPYAVFLEKWSYQGKDLYCIVNVLYHKNQNEILTKKLRYFKEVARTNFYSKNEAEKEYNDRLKRNNRAYPDNIQISNIKTKDDKVYNIRREYDVLDLDLKSDLYHDPYGNLNFSYCQFVDAIKEIK